MAELAIQFYGYHYMGSQINLDLFLQLHHLYCIIFFCTMDFLLKLQAATRTQRTKKETQERITHRTTKLNSQNRKRTSRNKSKKQNVNVNYNCIYTTRINLLDDEEKFVGLNEKLSAIALSNVKTVGYSVVDKRKANYKT